jgi:hypothetical protein
VNRVLEQPQTALGVRLGNGAHGLELSAGVTQRQLAVNQRGDIFGLSTRQHGPQLTRVTYAVGHDLAQQHVLQAQDGLGTVGRSVVLKGLVEVRVARLVVTLLGVQRAALNVEVGLQCRRAVDSVGSRAGRSQRSLTQREQSVASTGTRYLRVPWVSDRWRGARSSRAGRSRPAAACRPTSSPRAAAW